MARDDNSIIPLERVQSQILLIRGQKVILDSDLAALYGVTTSRLNEQVKRNQDRFPADFMFQLNQNEFENLKSHFATSSSNWGGRRKRPFAFTEHGALMAAAVLKTERAVQVSVYVVRAFVQLRRLLETNRELANRLEKIEKRLQQHDENIISLANTLNQLMFPKEEPSKERIGFLSESKDHKAKHKAKKKKRQPID